jgi:hypothetical protein
MHHHQGRPVPPLFGGAGKLPRPWPWTVTVPRAPSDHEKKTQASWSFRLIKFRTILFQGADMTMKEDEMNSLGRLTHGAAHDHHRDDEQRDLKEHHETGSSGEERHFVTRSSCVYLSLTSQGLNL